MFLPTILGALMAINSARAAPTADALRRRSSLASAADFAELQRAADLSSAAYSACQGTAFGVTITKQLNELLTDTQGYIGYDSSKQRITVVMRGSTTPQDFLNDEDIALVTPALSGVNFPAGVQVINGVYAPWASVHDDVISEVESLVAQYPSYTLESTGHSLGGALTYLSYIALAQNFPGKSLTSNALAAFAIGNDAFASFGAEQKGLLRRGNNVGDGVPNLYPEFIHYGTEFYGSGTAITTLECSGERDLTCSAGNGLVGVTAGHFQSFGVALGEAGCASLF